MNKNFSQFFLVLAVVIAIQWAFFRPTAQKQKPPPPPVAVKLNALPPVLKTGLVTTEAKAQFQKALADRDAGLRSADNEQQKHLNDAVKDLQQVKNNGSADPDWLAAQLEIAYIQWHNMRNQREAAAGTLNNLRLRSIPPSLLVPVEVSRAAWAMAPAHAAALEMYTAVTVVINRMNAHHSPWTMGWLSYQTIHFFVHACSFIGKDYRDALALIVLGVLVTVVLTPVRNWQFKTMARMQTLQPELKRIQQQYKGQMEEINRRTMELYKEHGANPLSGCLPMVVQLPFMWWLYYAIREYQYQLTGKFLWIGSAFSFAHTGWATPKGPVIGTSLANMDIPLLIVYTASMYVYSRLTPITSPDPAAARQSQNMSAMMSLMMPVYFYFYGWPSAFLLWWLAMNVTNILITVFYLRRHPDLKGMFSPPAATPATEPATNGSAATPTAGGESIFSQLKSLFLGESSTTPPADSGSESGSSSSTPTVVKGLDSKNGGAAPGARRIEPKNRRKSRGRRF